jgi:hypothetical protein
MALNTDFNAAPYYDDFDEQKNYHRVLFRPSVPIQARELTQLQSILQNQVERFGDNIYNKKVPPIVNETNTKVMIVLNWNLWE